MALPAENIMEAERATAAMLANWRAIAAALAPIIGGRGFTALYQRALRRAASGHPWLDDALVRDDGDPLAALERVLAAQPPGEATAAEDALRDAFRELLEHLLGAALARRLVGEQLPARQPPIRDGNNAA